MKQRGRQDRSPTPMSLPGRGCHPLVPKSLRVSLAKRKAQGSIADCIFHHRVVAPQGVGAFGLGGPSSLKERQNFSSYHSSPHPSSPTHPHSTLSPMSIVFLFKDFFFKPLFVTILLLSSVSVCWFCGTWNPSYLTKDGTQHALHWKAKS